MESLEYIDNYFKGEAPPDQKLQFEQRVLVDKEFAEEVSFYLSTIQVLRDENAVQKKKLFSEIYHGAPPVRQITPVRRLWPYVASAAAVLIAVFLGLYIFMQPEPSKLADDYLKEHLQTMSMEMGSNADSIQQGKDLYNNKDYQASLQMFELIMQNDTANYEAKELAGIVALKLKDFDKALLYFQQEAKNNNLHVNPGKFYQALTYMKRNQQGDEELARNLLQEVVNKKLAYSEDAVQLLEKL